MSAGLNDDFCDAVDELIINLVDDLPDDFIDAVDDVIIDLIDDLNDDYNDDLPEELNDELKPCPFCGKEPKINQSEFSHRYWVACEDCCCLNKVFYTKDEAIKAWNSRHIEDEKDNQIKELKNDLAFSDKWTK